MDEKQAKELLEKHIRQVKTDVLGDEGSALFDQIQRAILVRKLVKALAKLAAFLLVLAVGYGAFRFLFGRGWLGTSACFLVWFLLASLYVSAARSR